jgi:glycine cleavage system protein P-like pyridoxal-binding family
MYRELALKSQLKATETQKAQTYDSFVESLTKSVKDAKLLAKLLDEGPPSTACRSVASTTAEDREEPRPDSDS